MSRYFILVNLFCCFVYGSEFVGWQGMRVLRYKNPISKIIIKDLDEDGRDEILVLNPRWSRIDVYRWLTVKDRVENNAKPRGVNELPMAPEFSQSSIQFNTIPSDFLLKDLDGDKIPELFVLGVTPNCVLIYKKNKKGVWEKKHSYELPRDNYTDMEDAMLLRKGRDGEDELLISSRKGIRILNISKPSKVGLLLPREKEVRRVGWKLLDIDGDGDNDLIEWRDSSRSDSNIFWYECIAGELHPAQPLLKEKINGFTVFKTKKHGVEVVLYSRQRGVISSYIIGTTKKTPFGKKFVLPFKEENCNFVTVMIDKKPCVVQLSKYKPMLTVFSLTDAGWKEENSFPTVNNVKKLLSLPALPGTLLIQVKNSADVYISKWQNNRFSYPVYLHKEVDDKCKILRLSMTNAGTVWWVQEQDQDLKLFFWNVGDTKPSTTIFTGAGGGKFAEVQWLAKDKLLVKKPYTENSVLLTLQKADEKSDKKAINNLGMVTVYTEPDYLKTIPFEELHVVKYDGKILPVRMSDGVVQWLDPKTFIPIEQTMLEDEKLIASFVPRPNGEAWAVESNGEKLYIMKKDKAGILRTTKSIKIPAAKSLIYDKILGLMLVDRDKITVLKAGNNRELQLKYRFDNRVLRFSGNKESTIAGIDSTDVDGDGYDDLIMLDGEKHILTAMRVGGKKLKTIISWKVFNTNKYPYGGEENYANRSKRAEPYIVKGADVDGDKQQDLILACHDRLIIYLGKMDKKTGQKGK